MKTYTRYSVFELKKSMLLVFVLTFIVGKGMPENPYCAVETKSINSFRYVTLFMLSYVNS